MDAVRSTSLSTRRGRATPARGPLYGRTPNLYDVIMNLMSFPSLITDAFNGWLEAKAPRLGMPWRSTRWFRWRRCWSSS